MPFLEVPKKLKLDVTLNYIAFVVNSKNTDYVYGQPLGGFLNHDETEYDLIAWYDADPKPLWSDIMAYWELAYDAAGLTEPANDRFDNLESYQHEIDDQLEEISDDVTALQSDVSALQSSTASLGSSKIATAEKGAANGVAPLDSSSLIPAVYLPSYVDDVLEYANLAAFPGTGTSGKIYVAIDTGKTYRWGGSAYAEISASPGSSDAVPEGSANLYFTNARARAAFQYYAGTTAKIGAFPISKSAVVALGNAVFHLTDDGLSTGNALFPNGDVDLDSMNFRADNEVDSPHQYGTPVLSNGNKTVTVPVKKSTGLYISLLSLTLLGAPAAANGSVIKMQVWGR